MATDYWYPSVEDILAIHEDIVSEYANTSDGVQSQGDLEFVISYIQDGTVGSDTDSIHTKAYHLLRLLVANHPFVDANKRTALNTATVFYLLNGYRFEYDWNIRSVLRRFASEADADEEVITRYLSNHTEAIELEAELETWREELIQHGLEHLTDENTDPND
jgi:death-on-curing protein